MWRENFDSAGEFFLLLCIITVVIAGWSNKVVDQRVPAITIGNHVGGDGRPFEQPVGGVAELFAMSGGLSSRSTPANYLPYRRTYSAPVRS